MPIDVLGNSSSSYDNGNKIDTSLFVQKPYLRTNYIEANIEEDINMKNQYRIKNLPFPQENQDAVCKSYVDNLTNDSSILKNSNPHPDIDLKYKKIIKVGLIEVNRIPEWGDQVTSKFYVDNAIRNNVDESSLLRLDPDEKLKLDEQDSIVLNSTSTLLETDIVLSKTKIELPTKNYVDNKFDDPTIVRNNAHIDLNDKNITNARFIQVNEMPQIDSHLTAKLYVDKKFNDPSIIRNTDHVDFNDKNINNV